MFRCAGAGLFLPPAIGFVDGANTRYFGSSSQL